MRSTDPADARLQDLLSRPLPDDAEHIEAIELLAQHPAFEEARAVARSWADDARESISVLDEGPVRGALEGIVRLRGHPHRLDVMRTARSRDGYESESSADALSLGTYAGATNSFQVLTPISWLTIERSKARSISGLRIPTPRSPLR